jgi:hypothetical protein
MPAAFRIAVKVDDLPGGVDTGIGTPGTNHPYRMIGYPGQGCFNVGLYRACMGLTLPAKETGAVVLYSTDNPHPDIPIIHQTTIQSGRVPTDDPDISQSFYIGCCIAGNRTKKIPAQAGIFSTSG